MPTETIEHEYVSTGLMRRRLYNPAHSAVQARLTGIAAVLEEWLQLPPPPRPVCPCEATDGDNCHQQGNRVEAVSAVPGAR